MFYKEKIQIEIKRALGGVTNNILVERPKLKEHGDIATNIAMVLAKEQKRNPLDIANEIKKKIETEDLIAHIDVVKPGFINFVVADYSLAESLCEVHKLGQDFGFSPKKTKEKILIEFVSANPTGDLHIGHGRQAIVGSSLANLLEAAGYTVAREFYINDYGEQIENLSETAFAIYKKFKGENVEWKEDFYPEEIILPYVKRITEDTGTLITKESLGEAVKDLILKVQKELLSSIKVDFDMWFSEKDLHKNKALDDILNKLNEKNYAYKHEGAIWFNPKEFNESRDRVLIRSDGRPTYLLADIAYHINKLSRSYDHLITIWGADHHGQEVSLKGALKALGYDENKLEVIFVQLVSLKKEGQEVKMSKRGGAFVTIEEVLSEVGLDAFRFFLVENHPNNRMIFDIDLAKKQDKDNPVYYIQYAHARCCSILRQVADPTKPVFDNDYSSSPEVFMSLFKTNNQEYLATKNLILRILDFPEEVQSGATTRSPSRIANFLKDLATDFHSFYTVCRVISKEANLTKARLGLVEACKITINNGLKILGLTAPEVM